MNQNEDQQGAVAIPEETLESASPLSTASPTGAASAAVPAPLVTGKMQTWGQKVFDGTIYGGGMFGVNLFLSAALMYFTHHHDSPKKLGPLPLSGTKIYGGLKAFNQRLLGSVGLKLDKEHYLVKVLTNAFTLLMGGHIVALAMVKPAEDRKSNIVRALDEWHYGKNAEDNPEILAAHGRVDQEAKTTWLGTFIGRMVSWATVQLAAASFGSEEKNLVKFLGKKMGSETVGEFRGVEGYSKDIGTRLAEWSPQGLRNAGRTVLGPIGGKTDPDAFKHYSEYTAMDTMYTVITALIIKPINNFLADHFPSLREKYGMPIHQKDRSPVIPKSVGAPQADEAAQTESGVQAEVSDTPDHPRSSGAHRVSGIVPQGTFAPAPLLEMGGHA